MTREEIYLMLGRIEWLISDLETCVNFNVQPEFRTDDNAKECGEYAEKICAYIRATNDKQVMIDCCKINRSTCYRFGGSDNEYNRAIRTVGRYLRVIHDITLERIWLVPREQIINCTYYVNSFEGVCRNSDTGELLPIPANENEKTPNDIQSDVSKYGLPSELDTEKARTYLVKAIEAGFLDKNYKPIKSKMTRYQQKQFALLMAVELELSKRWSVFETFWNIKNMAQIDLTSSNQDKLNKIKSLFPKETVDKTRYK